jgi:CSLREA domain-containing protein
MGADEVITAQFNSATYNVNESDGAVTVTITRTAGSGTPATINYSTSSGTATGGTDCSAPGADYQTTSGSLSFAAGDISKTFNVPICMDAYEGGASENFTVNLGPVTGNTIIGTPATATVTIVDVDSIAPDTTITAGPPPLGNSPNPSFSFNGNDPGGSGVASFECQLDGAVFAPCVSPQNYTSLSGTSHTFQVRAKDVAGNVDPTPASYPFVISLTPPSVAISAPSRSLANGGDTVTHTVTYGGADTITLSSANIALSGTAGAHVGVSGSGTTRTVTLDSFTGDGPLGISISAGTASDNAGNSAGAAGPSATFTVDTTAPSVTINRAGGQPSTVTNATAINFTVVFSEPVTGFTAASVHLSASTAGGTLAAVVSEITPMDGTTYNVEVSGMNASGLVTAIVTANAAQDVAGNPSLASTSTDNQVTYQQDNSTSFVVNSLANTDDGGCDPLGTGNGNHDCTLREAINAANADFGAENITFDPALTTAGAATITLSLPLGALPDITDDVTVTGPTTNGLTISGDYHSRVFTIAADKTVAIANLTIMNGQDNFGGGIFNLGNLTISNSTFTGNKAVGGSGEGGAIDSEGGSLTVINSTISGNTAETSGGGLLNCGTSTAVLTNVTITNNRADEDGANGVDASTGAGGGIAQVSSNPLSLNNTIVAGNLNDAPPGTTADDILAASGSGSINAASSLVGDAGTSGSVSDGVSGNKVGNSGSGTIDINTVLITTLANHGGPTGTHLLTSGSPAINAGDNALAQDQNKSALLTISATAGTPQIANTNTAFAMQLQAVIAESGVNQSGLPVTFTAPASGASGTFPGNVGTATITSDSNGVATAPVFTANGTGGSYQVTASPGTSSSATTFAVFSLTNNAVPLANNQSLSTEEDTSKVITLTGSDAESNAVSFTVTSDPAHGTLSGTAPDLTYMPAVNYNGPDSFTFRVNDGQADSVVDGTVSITVTAVNDAPTLDPISDPAAIFEDAGQQTVNLSGIGAGPVDESSQTLTVTALSSNTALIPNPTVTYTSPNATGLLSYTPLADASGSAVITVTVMDNGGTTDGGIDQVTQIFTVNVTAVNDAPTLDPISDPAAIPEDAGQQTINLSGIGAGPGDESGQTLTVTALSSNTALIPNPTVTYTSPNVTGKLSITPVANQVGSAVITVTVRDNGGTDSGGADQLSRTFTVNVTPTTTYAEASGNCGAGNTPCYTTIQAAIDALTSGGKVNLMGGTFNEDLDLSTDITVNVNANTAINSFTISAGTLNGSNGGNFTLTLTAGDWNNNGGTFNPGAGTVSFAGSGQTIGGTNPTTFNNLTIGGAGTTVNTTTSGNQSPSVVSPNPADPLSVDITITGLLTLNGDLTVTSPAKLVMPAGAGSAGSGDVIGTVHRTGFVTGACAHAPCSNTFSFGNPDNQITITGGGAPSSIDVNLVKSAPATFTSAVKRTYDISETGGSGFTAILRLHYLDGELNGNNESNLNLRRFSGSWQSVTPTAVDATNNWVESNAVTGFSPWTLAASLAPTATNGTISGRILGDDASPIAGAVVRLSGAQTRKTITDSNGNYRFSNTETTGFYTVTPARVNYNFSPFNRSFNQLGSQTEAAFGGTFTGDSANPLDTPEYFVRQQYVDVLGREPDETGFNFWSDRILVCGNDADCIRSQRIAVAAEFFIHQEFQQSGAWIYNLYESSLNRRPEFNEYALDRQQVLGGPGLEAEKQAFAESFVQREEFVQKYQSGMTAESFVDALLTNLRQSAGVDLAGRRDSLLARYNAGANQIQSRSFVLRDLSENASLSKATYNQAFVLTEYFGYLRRDPDQRGYTFWLNVLSEIGRKGDPGNYNRMVCSFITSTEYQQRFSSVVSHGNGECGQ